MVLPDYTTQDAATYKANIDSTADDHETRLDAAETKIGSLTTVILDIGDWNMDTASSVNVAHGLTMADIRSVTVHVRSDDAFVLKPLNYIDNANTNGWFDILTTNVRLNRLVGGLFDNTSYNDTSYNRGWIIIQHV